jgi:ribosomal protein S6
MSVTQFPSARFSPADKALLDSWSTAASRAPGQGYYVPLGLKFVTLDDGKRQVVPTGSAVNLAEAGGEYVDIARVGRAEATWQIRKTADGRYQLMAFAAPENEATIYRTLRALLNVVCRLDVD